VLLLSLYWIAETTAFLHASEVAFLGVRDEAADLKLDGYHRRRQISTHQYAQPVTKPDDSIIDQGTGVTRFQLLSLQYTPVESGTSVGLVPRFSKAAADAWRWKDAVLGDGRDFFVPRPKTLQKLGLYLQEEIPEIQECIILSNCARFEILVALDGSLDSNDLSLAISRRVIAQVEYYQKKVNPATKMMVSSMDWPGVVAGSSDLTTLGKDSEQTAEELQSLWTHMTELTEIMNHLAQVAVGLALRPRRPDRPVQFRPFSSRDAHILLQLKRTVEAFSSSPSPSPQLAQLLKFALQAGKAARDTQKVPELSALLLYGSGDSQKYSTQPPPELLQNVTDVSSQSVQLKSSISIDLTFVLLGTRLL